MQAVLLSEYGPDFVEARGGLGDGVLKEESSAASNACEGGLLLNGGERKRGTREVHGCGEVGARVDKRAVHVEEYSVHFLVAPVANSVRERVACVKEPFTDITTTLVSFSLPV